MMTDQPLPSPAPSMVGQTIGHYRLVRMLGEGGMGMVFEAVHESVGGHAAIKVLPARAYFRAPASATAGARLP